jgi:16S rRNA (guanine1207-N2)-methyltransferase
MLNPGGQLWLVANRHLPYETTLRERFVKVEEMSGDSAFKVFHAVRPRK